MFLTFRNDQPRQLVLKLKYIDDGKLAIDFGKIQIIGKLEGQGEWTLAWRGLMRGEEV